MIQTLFYLIQKLFGATLIIDICGSIAKGLFINMLYIIGFWDPFFCEFQYSNLVLIFD